jgi:PAS domain S-box-containing protein
MTIKKKINVILTFAILLFLASAGEVFGATKVKIGVHETKPLSFIAEDGSLSGIYPEILSEIARISDWDIELIQVTWTEGLKMVQKGEINLLGPIAYTEERLQYMQFNKEAILIDWGQVYLPNPSKIKNILDLEGKKIVFQKDHMMGKTLNNLLKRFDIDYVSVPVKNQKKVFEMVADGEADAGVVNRLFGLMNEKEYGVQRSPIIHSPLELRFAAPKAANDKILGQLDSSLKKMKTGKKSNYHNIIDKWLFGELNSGRLLSFKQIFMIIGIGFAIVIIMLLWMVSLKSQVKSRTKELAESTQQLKETNLLLNAVMKNTTDAVFIKNLEGEYILANESTYKAMGKPLKQVIGKTDVQLFPKGSADIIQEVDALVVAEGKPQLAEEKIDTAYGETYWLANKSPYFDESNNVVGIIGISRNITELKNAQFEKEKLQNQLSQAHKMEAIGTLTGGIAHDFNNILSPILGFTEMLQEDLPKNSPEQANLSQIIKAGFRAKDLVRQILTFSRQNDHELIPIKIQSILKEALKLLRSSIPKTIDIQTEIDPYCGVVLIDPTQLHQIIMNLATNAYHAMQDSGGKLTVILKQIKIELKSVMFSDLIPGKYALLKVIDTGIGIKKDMIDKIFDPYFTTKKKDKGTGLGLSIVQGIIKSCHGHIHIYSEYGQGTEIHVYLPIMKESSGKRKIDQLSSIKGGTEKILIVDDEESIVKMEKKMLERLGYRVTATNDSRKALEIFKANPEKFDLVITDMTMPYMTGIQLANEIKNTRIDTPIIICSGFSDQVNQDTYEEIGIQGYITKPVIKREMAQMIKEVFDKVNNISPMKSDTD